jgi:serine/threonine protein phosphatase PrpC
LHEIKSRYIGINDKFVVIGSDGVFEFLSNQDAAEVVLPFCKINQPENAANAIVKAGHLRWREDEEIVDDITAVVIFMEPIMEF